MKKIVFLMLIMFAGFNMQAQEKKNKNAKHQIEVKGNCEQCKNRIEKAAFGVKGVKTASWDAESQSLQLILDERKCSINDVSAAVAETGHDTKTDEALDENYDNLPMCCKYDRN